MTVHANNSGTSMKVCALFISLPIPKAHCERTSPMIMARHPKPAADAKPLKRKGLICGYTICVNRLVRFIWNTIPITDSGARKCSNPLVRFSLSNGNMVRKAIIKGICSGCRNSKASKIKEITGTDRIRVSNGLNNPYTCSCRANNNANNRASTPETSNPATPLPKVASTDR